MVKAASCQDWRVQASSAITTGMFGFSQGSGVLRSQAPLWHGSDYMGLQALGTFLLAITLLARGISTHPVQLFLLIKIPNQLKWLRFNSALFERPLSNVVYPLGEYWGATVPDPGFLAPWAPPPPGFT